MTNYVRLAVAGTIAIILHFPAISQSVSINTDGSTAHASAMLDVKSTSKGMLIPRMSKAERNAIASPATGLMVFQNAPDSVGFYFYNGATWFWITQANTGWSTTGNAGTDTATNFLGTTDAMPLRFRQNNLWLGQLNRNNGNYFLGASSGMKTTGSGNTGFGDSSLALNTTGANNIALGRLVLKNHNSGDRNVAIGYNAMNADTASSDNIAIGANSLQNGKQTIYNVAIGAGTLMNAGVGRTINPPGSFDGDYNTAVGYSAGTNIKRGYSNTSIGAWSHINDSSGIGNTYVGTLSGTSQVGPTVLGNSGVGWFSLFSNLTGSQNSALGSSSGFDNSTGANNIFIGSGSGGGNVSGSGNIFLGVFTEANSTNLVNATAIGYQSVVAQSNSIVLGSIAGANGASTTVSVGIGENSPNARLHIKRNGASGGGFHGSSSMIIEDNASSYLQFSNPAANETGFLSGSDLTTIRSVIIFRADSSLQLRTGGNSSRITIDNTGFTGIRTTAPQNYLDVNGSTGSPIQTTTTNTILDEFDHTLVISNIAGAITVTLPAASTCFRREYVIVNQDNGAKTITSYLDFTGASSTVVPANGSITLQSNGTNWYRIR